MTTSENLDSIKVGEIYRMKTPPSDKPGWKGDCFYADNKEGGLILLTYLDSWFQPSFQFRVDVEECELHPISRDMLTNRERKELDRIESR